MSVRTPVVALLGLLALGGCGKSRYAQRWEEYAEAVCACSDLKCYEEARKEMSQEIKAFGDDPGGSASDGALVDAAHERVNACVKAMKEAEAAAP